MYNVPSNAKIRLENLFVHDYLLMILMYVYFQLLAISRSQYNIFLLEIHLYFPFPGTIWGDLLNTSHVQHTIITAERDIANFGLLATDGER